MKAKTVPITSLYGRTIGKIVRDYRGLEFIDTDGNTMFVMWGGHFGPPDGYFETDLPYTRVDGSLRGKYAK